MIRINLLPYREEKRKADIKRQVIFIVGIFLLFFIIVGSLQLFMTLSVNSLQAEVKSAETRLAILTKITGDLDKFKKDKELLEKKIAIIENLEKGRTLPVHILDEFAERIPVGKVWLVTIKKSDDALLVEGVAIDNPAVALFMTQLERSSYFQSVDLISSEQTLISNVKLMTFTLSLNMEKG